MTYRPDIDGLRAVAAGMIVLYHLGLDRLSGGFAGVDVFFVISGFLITGLLQRDIAGGQFRYLRFLGRRVRRLGPSLLATLAGTLVVGYWVLAPEFYEELGWSTLAALASVSNILFWTQTGYFDTAAQLKPLLHTWSLGVEEQFYLVWPFLLIAVLTLRAFLLRAALLIVLAVVSLVAAEVMIDLDPAAAFYLMPFRVAEFCCGALLALAPAARLPRVVAEAASLTGLGLIAATAVLIDETVRFPGLTAMIPALGAMLILAAGPVALGNRLLSIAPMRYVGHISYALYLVHWPVLVYFSYYQGGPDTLTETALLTGVSLALAALLTHGIEAPFRRRDASGFHISTGVLRRTLGGAAVATVGATAVVIAMDGLPGRLPEGIRAMEATLTATREARQVGIRGDKCHLKQSNRKTFFDTFDECLPPVTDRMIVVVGDSHAADVWAGLVGVYPDRTVVQLTGAGCDFGRTFKENHRCTAFAQLREDWISEHRDRISAVIYTQRAAAAMTGRRSQIAQLGLDDTAIDAIVARTNKYAESIPVIFLGPRPEFHPSIKLLISQSVSAEMLEQRLRAVPRDPYEALDRKLANALRGSAVSYVSTIETICAPECDILLPSGDPVNTDYGHWSPDGARHMIRQLVAQSDVFAALLQPAD